MVRFYRGDQIRRADDLAGISGPGVRLSTALQGAGLSDEVRTESIRTSSEQADAPAKTDIRQPTLSDVIWNIDHVVKLLGIDHIGLGSDFDGVGENLPRGLKDVSCYPNLIYELMRNGCAKDDISKICSDNFLRLWSDIRQTARRLQSDTQVP